MKKAILFVALFWCTSAFGQDGHSLWGELFQRWDDDHIAGGVRDISNRDELCVSLLLPLEDNAGRMDVRFGEFYRGALLALEELREHGISARIRLFDTPRDEDAVTDILSSEEFEGTDLIIGPVYADGIESVMNWAEERGVAVISPLTVLDAIGSEVLYQMAPTQSTKYDKLASMLTREGVNIIYVSTANPDREMDTALLPLLGGVSRISVNSNTSGSQLEALFDRRATENIFVISCKDDSHLADVILNKISSVYSNLTARSATTSQLRVVGNASWARFPDMVKELYFKLGVCYVSNYHVDRLDGRVRDFDGRYIARFGDIPPSAAPSGGRETQVRPYAYRGYDAVKLFTGAAMTIGDDFTSKVNAEGHELLQVSYLFEQSVWGDFRNTNWPMVVYRPDYTIEVY